MYNNTLITHSYHVDNRDKAINAAMPKNPPTPHYKIHNRQPDTAHSVHLHSAPPPPYNIPVKPVPPDRCFPGGRDITHVALVAGCHLAVTHQSTRLYLVAL